LQKLVAELSITTFCMREIQDFKRNKNEVFKSIFN
jgi:hypothetical protein